MKKTINLFVDMDGTVANFYHDKQYLERMFEKGYFANLPAYAIAKEIDEFAKQDTCVQVIILSACVESDYCKQEKIAWLKKYMPNVKQVLLTEVGQNKVEQAKQQIENFGNYTNILLDDYTHNLKEWVAEKGCYGVKYLNGLNGKNKTWQGAKVKNFNGLLDIIHKIAIYGRP